MHRSTWCFDIFLFISDICKHLNLALRVHFKLILNLFVMQFLGMYCCFDPYGIIYGQMGSNPIKNVVLNSKAKW